jgi:D-xylonolactonase
LERTFLGPTHLALSADGTVDREIEMPFDNPTMVAFGGSDYRTLFISSGRGNLTPEQLSGQPLAGGIFKMQVDTPGLPEPLLALYPASASCK